MRDFEIRHLLKTYLHSTHRKEPGTRILDELNLCEGSCRVDVAVVNGFLSGYEIKGSLDTLYRLPSQSIYYSKALDFVTVVADAKHIDHVFDLVPEWWGITSLSCSQKAHCFLDIHTVVREPERNPSLDALALAQLLWKDEVLLLLKNAGVKKISSKPRFELWRIAAAELPVADLATSVRSCLKARTAWKGECVGGPTDNL